LHSPETADQTDRGACSGRGMISLRAKCGRQAAKTPAAPNLPSGKCRRDPLGMLKGQPDPCHAENRAVSPNLPPSARSYCGLAKEVGEKVRLSRVLSQVSILVCLFPSRCSIAHPKTNHPVRAWPPSRAVQWDDCGDGLVEHGLENGKETRNRLVVDNTNPLALTMQAKCIIQRGVKQTEF